MHSPDADSGQHRARGAVGSSGLRLGLGPEPSPIGDGLRLDPAQRPKVKKFQMQDHRWRRGLYANDRMYTLAGVMKQTAYWQG